PPSTTPFPDPTLFRSPGDVIGFTFNRGGQSQTAQVQAGDDGHGVAKVGVALQTKNLRYDFPVQVTIATGKVAGPSAGLAFTLALLDDLAAGDLTGGKKVAVTGTIDVNGRVGPVGGVAQKTGTAPRAGAVALLVAPLDVSSTVLYLVGLHGVTALLH